jgi:alpha-1,2-mannosyltransferase
MDDRITHSAAAPAPRRWFIVGLLLLFIALSVQYTIKITRKGESSSAFNRWRPQVLGMAKGEDSYVKYAYPNPPMMALILLPYYLVPELAGALAWYYTKVALTLLALMWTFRLVEDPERPFPDWAKALVVLLSLKPIMGDLTHGNVNLLILFLCVGALYAYQHRHEFGGGAILGLAIVCKVTPALFLPYFVWKRAWKTLIGCCAGMLLFYVVVPSVVFGPSRNVELLGSWGNLMVKPFLIGKVTYSEYFNQSVPGLIARLLTDSPSDTEWIEHREQVAVSYHNIASLRPVAAKAVLLGCMAVFAGVVMLVCRTPTEQRRGWRFAAEAGIVLVGMLLFSDRTWKHHCVTLCVPLAVLCYRLAWEEGRRRLGIAAALALTLLLMASTSTGMGERLDELGRLSQVYGAYVWAFVILVAALAVELWRGRVAVSLSEEWVSRNAPMTGRMRDSLPTLRAFKS